MFADLLFFVFVFQVFADRFVEREIQSLSVHCENHEHGCPWKGELRNREVTTDKRTALFFLFSCLLICFLSGKYNKVAVKLMTPTKWQRLESKPFESIP